LILREERSVRTFENRAVRKIFGLKRDELTGSWIKLHTEELHNLYCSPRKMIESRPMVWAGHVARMSEK
jgi:PAS domain-containing protein